LTLDRYEIKYKDKGKGITWKIRRTHKYQDIPICAIEVKINPKVLTSGIANYFDIANQQEVLMSLKLVKAEAWKISEKLYDMFPFKLSRVDYCINFDMKALGYLCSDEQMMELIKRGNIPHHFNERVEYDKISHRMKTDKISFYLMSKSVIVNCYQKDEQQRRYNQNRGIAGTPDMPSHIIRFEVQCLYNKLYNIKNEHNFQSDEETMEYILSDNVSKNILTNYFRRVIMGGQYMTKAEAIDKIKSYVFMVNKKYRKF